MQAPNPGPGRVEAEIDPRVEVQDDHLAVQLTQDGILADLNGILQRDRSCRSSWLHGIPFPSRTVPANLFAKGAP